MFFNRSLTVRLPGDAILPTCQTLMFLNIIYKLPGAGSMRSGAMFFKLQIQWLLGCSHLCGLCLAEIVSLNYKFNVARLHISVDYV